MKPIGELIRLADRAGKVKPGGKRQSPCEDCGELHGGATYICVRCVDDHRKRLRVKAQRCMVETIPEAYRECRFGTARMGCVAENYRQSVAASKARGLTITGHAGVGKTTLAVAKLFQLFDEGARSCLFVSACDLARARAVHPLGVGEAPLVSSAMQAGVVVIDDLGKEKQDIAGAVSDVIFARHAKGLRTIVTAGFGVEAARTKYDDGIARRLFEEDWVIIGGKQK